MYNVIEDAFSGLRANLRDVLVDAGQTDAVKPRHTDIVNGDDGQIVGYFDLMRRAVVHKAERHQVVADDNAGAGKGVTGEKLFGDLATRGNGQVALIEVL